MKQNIYVRASQTYMCSIFVLVDGIESIPKSLNKIDEQSWSQSHRQGRDIGK